EQCKARGSTGSHDFRHEQTACQLRSDADARAFRAARARVRALRLPTHVRFRLPRAEPAQGDPSPRYQPMSASPQKMNKTAPSARNGPNGIAYLVSDPVQSMSATPTTDPVREDNNIVNGTDLQPRKAPIMPSSLMSPPPMPSRPVHAWYPHATASSTPPPVRMPMADDTGPGSPRSERTNPTTMPGRLMTSGMIR